MKSRIFVSGATGFQGSNIASFLLKKGKQVVTIKPDPEEIKNPIAGLEILEGNLEDEDSILKALKDVDVAVFTFPLIFDLDKAVKITDNFIQSAKKCNVSLIVFNSSFDLPKEMTGLLALDLKSRIYKMFEGSGLNVITLVPDIYIDNLTAPWSIPLIVEKGILPYPVQSGKEVPWISHKDLARFVGSAVDNPQLAGSKLPIGGSIYTGEEIAAAISNHLGKVVKFIGLTPDDFEKQLIPAFGDLNAKEISNLYRYVADNREALLGKDFLKTQGLLSTKPSSIQEWVSSVDWNM